jgi:hypothetical protein
MRQAQVAQPVHTAKNRLRYPRQPVVAQIQRILELCERPHLDGQLANAVVTEIEHPQPSQLADLSGNLRDLVLRQI